MNVPELDAVDWSQTQEAARKAVEAFATLLPMFEKLGRALLVAGEKIDQHLWQAYREAGQPYGPNYRGRDRWLVEQGELARAQEALAEAQVWEHATRDLALLVADRKIA